MSAASKQDMQSLRERQTTATRNEIVATAMTLLIQEPDVSHELIAKSSGMSARTVYRHFPDRASLMLAVWRRLRDMMQIQFPSVVEEIVPLTRQAFGALNANEAMAQAVMSSVAGARIGNLPGHEGKHAFTESLGPLLAGLPLKQRRMILGCFVAIFSAPFWQLLRNRGELTAAESLEASTWILSTLLESLHSNPKRKKQTP